MWVGIDLIGFILPSLSWIHSCWLEFAAIGLDLPSLGFVLLLLGPYRHCQVVFAAVGGSRVETTENSTSREEVVVVKALKRRKNHLQLVSKCELEVVDVADADALKPPLTHIWMRGRWWL